jgi:NAD(P)H dehydrogenase (quinone)
VTKVAITAASGKLGSAIAKTAIAHVGKENVVGLARTPGKAAALGVETRPGDYDSPSDLKRSLGGIDALVLVSGMAAPEKRILQHRNVIEAAKQAGVKKIVYTSIQGPETGTAFSPVVRSNRQTEEDVRNSGLDWAVGRNGIYIEPDVDYLDNYRERGEIANCAADGLCGYTTRDELAAAYVRMALQTEHNGRTFNLHGDAISQTALADHFNAAFGTHLGYRAMSVTAFREDRIAELGGFIGNIIAGIYEGIRNGAFNNPSDFQAVAGRPHVAWPIYFERMASS